jgi:membrane protein YqaA with SNARE-associated domain
MPYLLAGLLIYGVNLLPAFGPPTWAVLAFLVLNYPLHPVLLIPIGACAATAGRLTLAVATRHARGRLAAHRRESLAQVHTVLTANRGRVAVAIGVFLLSPLPSSQLFIGAGLLNAALPPLAAAFFIGRLVSYSVYVHGAMWARETFGNVLLEQFHSPWAIALQLLSLAALGALLAVDWRRVFDRHHHRGM